MENETEKIIELKEKIHSTVQDYIFLVVLLILEALDCQTYFNWKGCSVVDAVVTKLIVTYSRYIQIIGLQAWAAALIWPQDT